MLNNSLQPARTFLVAMCWAVGCTGVAAQSFTHTWRGSSFVPCEGLGVHGAFSVHVNGVAQSAQDGSRTITSLQVHTTSGAFTQNEGSTASSAEVKVAGTSKQRVILARPTHSVVEAAPKPDETRRLYLAKDTKLVVPKGGELWVEASAVAKTSGGTCALGSTRQKVPLP